MQPNGRLKYSFPPLSWYRKVFEEAQEKAFRSLLVTDTRRCGVRQRSPKVRISIPRERHNVLARDTLGQFSFQRSQKGLMALYRRNYDNLGWWQRPRPQGQLS